MKIERAGTKNPDGGYAKFEPGRKRSPDGRKNFTQIASDVKPRVRARRLVSQLPPGVGG